MRPFVNPSSITMLSSTQPSSSSSSRIIAPFSSYSRTAGLVLYLIMIITTTNSIEGKRIVDYKGIVSGEVIVGINVLKDMFASVRNFIGGRSKGYEEELVKARDNAMRELEERAERLGANAIVGVDIDYQVLGADNGMMMVIASGTAVYCQ
jgi:uncharacterized protein YbjQ (UPF0145 family)